MLKKRLIEKLAELEKTLPNLVVPKNLVGAHAGFTTEYLEAAGLSKQDLKRLERAGVAVRGRTNNFGKPNAQCELRWVLFRD